jgi:hypothetical protein
MAQPKQLTEIPVGNMKEIRPESLIRDLMRQARLYGPIYQLPFPGGKRLVILSSFALVDEVLTIRSSIRTSRSVLKLRKNLQGMGSSRQRPVIPNDGKRMRS